MRVFVVLLWLSFEQRNSREKSNKKILEIKMLAEFWSKKEFQVS